MLRPRMAGREREGFHLEGSSSALRRIAAWRCFCVSRMIVQRGVCRLALLGSSGLCFPRSRTARGVSVGAGVFMRLPTPTWLHGVDCAGWRCWAHADADSRMAAWRGLRQLALLGLSGLRFPRGRTARGVAVGDGMFIRIAFPAWPHGVGCAGWRCWAYSVSVSRKHATHAPGRNAKKRRSHLWLRRFAAPFYAGSRCSAAAAQ